MIQGNDRPQQEGELRNVFLIAVSNVQDIPSVAQDPISRRFLSDLPDFLAEQVQEGLETAGPDELLAWIHHSLRNNLHLSDIRTLDDVEVKRPLSVVEEVAADVFGDVIAIVPAAPTARSASPNYQLWDPSSLKSKGAAHRGSAMA